MGLTFSAFRVLITAFLFLVGPWASSAFALATTTTVSMSKTTFEAGEMVTVSGQVLLQGTTFPITDGEISFAYNVDTGSGFNSISLGSVALNSEGRGALTFSLPDPLTYPNNSIVAYFPGNQNDYASFAPNIRITVTKRATSIGVALASSSIAFDTTTTATFTVTPSNSTATGTVDIKVDGVTVASPTLTNGAATVTLSDLSVGNHIISGEYLGAAGFFASNSSTNPTLTVTKATATLSLAASNTAPTAGNSITLTATASASSVPTGTVTFFDGATSIRSASLVSGVASVTVSAITGGSHSYSASYGGDSSRASATSPSVSVTAAKATSSVALAASETATTAGTDIVLTATVTAFGTATGTVSFSDKGVALGSVTVSGGIATFTVDNITVGTHSFASTYDGDTSRLSSSSASVAVTAKGATRTVLDSSPAKPVAGDKIKLTASVISPVAATGKVTFFLGPKAIGSDDLSGGKAVIFVDTDEADSLTFFAQYAGTDLLIGSKSSGEVVKVGLQKSKTTAVAVGSAITTAAKAQIRITVEADDIVPSGRVKALEGRILLGSVALKKSDIRAHASSGVHGCLLWSDGGVACWQRAGVRAANVAGLPDSVKAIAVGAKTNYALASDGQVHAWPVFGKGSPKVVSGLPVRMSGIAATGDQLCVLALGRLSCGQPGSLKPVALPNGWYVDLKARDGAICAITTTGSAACTDGKSAAKLRRLAQEAAPSTRVIKRASAVIPLTKLKPGKHVVNANYGGSSALTASDSARDVTFTIR